MAPTNDESRLTALIKEKIAKLPDLPENPCIYKIPKNLRSVKEKAYTPYRVAIGPYHADDPALMPMNHYKLKCLDFFISWNTKLQLEDCVKAITSTQDCARKYYADIEYLSSDDFVQMLLIDGAFIIKFILCIVGLITNVDVVFTKTMIASEIIRDLIVLENQLPFFILDHLYKLICDEKIETPFILVVYNALSGMVPFKTGSNLVDDDIFRRLVDPWLENVQVKHLVHFMRLCCMPLPLQKEIDMSALNIFVTRDDESNTLFQPFLSATELHEAGVKIKKIASDKPLLQMKFSNGVLEIPHLVLDEFTEMFFRNIMAFEQYYLNTYEVTSFMYFMDHLVDTTKDVQILEQNDIILNCLESTDIVTAVLDLLGKHTKSDYKIAYYDAALYKMCRDLFSYARRPSSKWSSKWSKWMAMLRRDYFFSPWAVISFLAALLLLVLTLIQTVASVLQASIDS